VSGAQLVTGGAGFAGRHLVAALNELGEEPVVLDRSEVDLRDGDAVRSTVRELAPRAVFHLAALASVPRAWEAPSEVLLDNLAMTLNVLEAVRTEAPGATVLIAGSGEVYGAPESLPVEEGAPLRPQNPYAVSKAACDLLGGQYADAHGLGVVRTRAFNHAGPGQSDEYVLGTLTRQVAEAEGEGRPELTLRVGNLDSARDFTDVRDVVRAYTAAAKLPADVYNVCSGRSVTVRELVEALRGVTDVDLHVEVDPGRVRAHDVPEIRGSAERLRALTGWAPEIPLERTLRDAVAAWRERLTAGR
jgi:GDP-4-dehydro-6-deoxy-D-mannose reductase